MHQSKVHRLNHLVLSVRDQAAEAREDVQTIQMLPGTKRKNLELGRRSSQQQSALERPGGKTAEAIRGGARAHRSREGHLRPLQLLIFDRPRPEPQIVGATVVDHVVLRYNMMFLRYLTVKIRQG